MNYSDLMLWNLEPFHVSGFDKGNLGYLAAETFSIMLLLACVHVTVVATGPAKASALQCLSLSTI